MSPAPRKGGFFCGCVVGGCRGAACLLLLLGAGLRGSCAAAAFCNHLDTCNESDSLSQDRRGNRHNIANEVLVTSSDSACLHARQDQRSCALIG